MSSGPRFLSTETMGSAAVEEALAKAKGKDEIALVGMSLGDADAPAVAYALARSRSVTSLDLSANQLGDEGLAIIAKEVKGHPLDALNVSNNPLTTAAASTLAALVCNVRLLDVSESGVGDEGAESIAMALVSGDCTLETLRIVYAGVSDRGVLKLARALENPACPVESLWVARNNVTDSGAVALANASMEQGSRIKQIFVSYCMGVTDVGGEALARALRPGGNLVDISLKGCRVTDLTALAVCRSVHAGAQPRGLFLGPGSLLSPVGEAALQGLLLVNSSIGQLLLNSGEMHPREYRERVTQGTSATMETVARHIACGLVALDTDAMPSVIARVTTAVSKARGETGVLFSAQMAVACAALSRRLRLTNDELSEKAATASSLAQLCACALMQGQGVDGGRLYSAESGLALSLAVRSDLVHIISLPAVQRLQAQSLAGSTFEYLGWLLRKSRELRASWRRPFDVRDWTFAVIFIVAQVCILMPVSYVVLVVCPPAEGWLRRVTAHDGPIWGNARLLLRRTLRRDLADAAAAFTPSHAELLFGPHTPESKDALWVADPWFRLALDFVASLILLGFLRVHARRDRARLGRPLRGSCLGHHHRRTRQRARGADSRQRHTRLPEL